MEIHDQPWGGYLAYCPSCLARADPAVREHSPQRDPTHGQLPEWCVYCHGCGQRLHVASSCPTCPCPDRQWLETDDAARFGAAISPCLDRITDLDQAWTTGHDLCLVGIPPEEAASVAIELYA